MAITSDLALKYFGRTGVSPSEAAYIEQREATATATKVSTRRQQTQTITQKASTQDIPEPAAQEISPAPVPTSTKLQRISGIVSALITPQTAFLGFIPRKQKRDVQQQIAEDKVETEADLGPLSRWILNIRRKNRLRKLISEQEKTEYLEVKTTEDITQDLLDSPWYEEFMGWKSEAEAELEEQREATEAGFMLLEQAGLQMETQRNAMELWQQNIEAGFNPPSALSTIQGGAAPLGAVSGFSSILTAPSEFISKPANLAMLAIGGIIFVALISRRK